MAQVKTIQKRSPGRPRCGETHQCILSATLRLLEEAGFAAVTVERIAAEAGVGKTTIYRRWPNSTAVAMDAFLQEICPKVSFRNKGSARADLQQQMQKLVALMQGKPGEILRSLIAAAQSDAELLESFRTRFIQPRRDAAQQVIERGMANGEFAADLEIDVVLDALYGPLYYRLLIAHQPLTKAFTTQLLTQVLS